jgi:GNAT superfamily N-acetyltransferase
VKFLDAYLATVDGDEHAFYDQFNGIENLKYVVVAFYDGHHVGCGAIKEFQNDGMEIKRMYVDPTSRGKGIAKQILTELEKWAVELGYTKCILETGQRQVEAVALYKRCGYYSIPNYEPYTNMENSVCFEKVLT